MKVTNQVDKKKAPLLRGLKLWIRSEKVDRHVLTIIIDGKGGVGLLTAVTCSGSQSERRGRQCCHSRRDRQHQRHRRRQLHHQHQY